MKITDLVIGIKFEIEIYNRDGEKAIPPFSSKLETILDENNIVVNAPIFKGEIFPVHIGWRANVYFTHKKSLYFFPAKITGRSKKDEMPLMNLEITDNITRIQRRHFFRLNLSLPVSYREYNPLSKEDDDKEKEFKESTTIDVSGGGISFITDELLEFDMDVEGKLMLPNNKEIAFIGKIVRSENLYEVNPDKYKTALKFSTIENKNKEILIQYLHKEQIKLIRKGLLTND
ncbi:MAG TPA: hypothetical protein GXX36_05735 [Clostridiaceae bacterium]|nr:hypothetical protein [Clostridiaceae bacterium]HHV99060.1 hypothetical protein [Clostridiaceae bacterium]